MRARALGDGPSATTSTRCGWSSGSRTVNLTEQVRDGILRHTGPEPPATLEGRIVRLVDRIAYINHDIDDALRAGVLRFESLPQRRDRAARATGSAAHRDARAAISSSAPRRPATSSRARRSAARCCACASSCSSGVYLGPDAQREKPRIERMLRALFDHYAETSAAGAGRRRDGRAARDRLAGRDDRPLRQSARSPSSRVPQGF